MTEHFSHLYSVTILDQNPGRRAVALDHHVYDQLSNMWLRRSSEPQPYVMLTVTPVGEDYADLGFPLKSRTRSSILPSMADTGCHSCLGGMRLLPRLGMTADDLIPVSMKMHAANGKGINIPGAAILRFSRKSPYGEPRETRQITYITDNSDKLFLSREACISLGMITARFPTAGEAMSPSCPQLACAESTDETDIDTHQWLPTETETTPCANQISLCCTRGKQIKTAGISTGLLLIEHVQHLRTSAATHDARTTTQTHGRPYCVMNVKCLTF